MNFSKLYFGESDGRKEAERSNDQFLESFVDIGGVLDKVKNREKFLILGKKGTGKTALAYYLKYKFPENYFPIDITEIKLNELSRVKINQRKEEPYDRALSAWKFILLIHLLELIVQKYPETLRYGDRVRSESLLESVHLYGFYEEGWSSAFSDSLRNTPRFLVSENESYYISEIVSEILKIVKRVKIDSKYGINIILDGLDNLSINSREYLESMSGLIQAITKINHVFREHGSSSNIIVLLRSDIYTMIDHPDSQKILDDSGYEFDWNIRSTSDFKNSNLFKMLNKKSGIPLGEDIINLYFPDFRLNNTPIRQDVLSHTRFNPRDLLRLMHYIQEAYTRNMDNADGDLRLGSSVITTGIEDYAAKYFVGAARNELIKVGKGDDIFGAVIFDTLKNVRKRIFIIDDYITEYKDYTGNEITKQEAVRALKLLFSAGLIGNQVPGKTEDHIQFAYRHSGMDLYSKGPMVMHNSLIKAWGVPYSA